jgi:hypothetical protein
MTETSALRELIHLGALATLPVAHAGLAAIGAEEAF